MGTENLRTSAQNRHLYWLFGQLNIDKKSIELIVYDHTHRRTCKTSELLFIEALTLIKFLESLRRERQLEKQNEDEQMDRLRKGLIKSIFQFFDLQGKEVTMKYVKATACRAGGVDNFNDLTKAALTRLYAEFIRKQHAMIEITRENYSICQN